MRPFGAGSGSVREVVFWGATGQARVLREALSYAGFSLVAIFDNRPVASPFPDVPIHIGEPGFADWLASRGKSPRPSACVAIGGGRGAERLAIQESLRSKGLEMLTVVHPRAFVAADAKLGRGAQILA